MINMKLGDKTRRTFIVVMNCILLPFILLDFIKCNFWFIYEL